MGGKGPITRARGFALSPKESKVVFSHTVRESRKNSIRPRERERDRQPRTPKSGLQVGARRILRMLVHCIQPEVGVDERIAQNCNLRRKHGKRKVHSLSSALFEPE